MLEVKLFRFLLLRVDVEVFVDPRVSPQQKIFDVVERRLDEERHDNWRNNDDKHFVQIDHRRGVIVANVFSVRDGCLQNGNLD